MKDFSMEKLQSIIKQQAEKTSYNAIARKAGLPTSTIWRIATGKFKDTTLSKATKIIDAIETLQNK